MDADVKLKAFSIRENGQVSSREKLTQIPSKRFIKSSKIIIKKTS